MEPILIFKLQQSLKHSAEFITNFNNRVFNSRVFSIKFFRCYFRLTKGYPEIHLMFCPAWREYPV